MLRIFFLFTLLPFASAAQTSNLPLVIMSYNVENLFDTINDPDKNDEEFLPDGLNRWTTARYRKKLEKLSGVIASNEKNLPAVVGLIEIENRKVIEDLISTPMLKNGNYGMVHYESPYDRGMDVGMIYRKDLLNVLYSKPMGITIIEGPETTTRDILFVKALPVKGDTLYFFVNHWPSRRNGTELTALNRIEAARVLRTAVDSVFRFNPGARIIIMGDFNDYPADKSLSETLGADTIFNELKKGALFNMCYSLDKKGEGSYKFRGDWGMLDQFIVSSSVLNDISDYHVKYKEAKILKGPGMLYTNKETQESKPNATYGGNFYFGGVSDHLPVYIELSK